MLTMNVTITILLFDRTATTNGPISLAGAAGLGKYGYGNGFTVMERISGTVLRIEGGNHSVHRDG